MKHLYLFFKPIRYAFTSLAGLLVLGLLAAPETYGQAPVWQTAIGTDLTRSSSSEVRATAVDATGNVYVTGTCAGAINIGTTTVVSAGQDKFLWPSGALAQVPLCGLNGLGMRASTIPMRWL